MQNSTFNFDDFDISDASISIPPIPKFSDNGGSLASSTPYNLKSQQSSNSRKQDLGSPIPTQENAPVYNVNKAVNTGAKGFDSKLDASDFAISESDNNNGGLQLPMQRTPLRRFGKDNNTKFGFGGNILSPQVPISEVKRHFNDFSSAFPYTGMQDSLLLDRSIEVGRSDKGKQMDQTFSSIASSRGDSPMARKVMDKPGSAGTQQANSPEPLHVHRQPYKQRKTDSVSSNEKVTSSSSSPNFGEPKQTFKIPTGYGDDASFFQKLGIKQPVSSNPAAKPTTSSNTETDRTPPKTKADEPITLPDISGLSSIFSSEESSRPKGQKRGQVQHKTMLSVPLDSDEKGAYI